jgi:hypothetical protein
MGSIARHLAMVEEEAHLDLRLIPNREGSGGVAPSPRTMHFFVRYLGGVSLTFECHSLAGRDSNVR